MCIRDSLLLARLFARPANVLVLDEPTNDLDIETLELLEELLQEYSGTVLLVSHDRAFLNNVVTQTIAYEGNGHWRDCLLYTSTTGTNGEKSWPLPWPPAISTTGWPMPSSAATVAPTLVPLLSLM